MDVTLNLEQRHALEEAASGRNIFITGGAGTGKSVVLNEISRRARAFGKNVLLCAPTAAAGQLIRGITMHRAFNVKEGPLLTKKGLKSLVRTDARLGATDVLIVDEISMCRADLFDVMVGSIQKVAAKRSYPLQLIVVGDFFQLPPVVQTTNHEKEILEAAYGKSFGCGYAFQSKKWDDADFACIFLNETMRTGDKELIENLHLARRGDSKSIRYFARNSSKQRFDNGISTVGLKDDAERINMNGIRDLGQRPVVYKTELLGDAKESDVVHVPMELPLCPGARVFCKINDYQAGLFNGLQGTVKSLNDEVVVVQFDGRQEKSYVTKHTFAVNDYSLVDDCHMECNERGSYVQYPLDLGYAVTIHRSQGATFEAVNLDPYAWDFGQLYVALSRVRSINSLYIDLYLDDRYLIADPLVKEFYRRLESGETAPRKLKSAGKDYKTVTARIPEHLKESVNEVVAQWKGLGPDDRHKQTAMLVPENLKGEIVDFIASKTEQASNKYLHPTKTAQEGH